MTVGPSVGTTRPGAVPAGSMVEAPRGTIACLRFASLRASESKRSRRAKPARIRAIFSSIPWSRTSSRPAKRATTSAVRSSAVGPSPPLVTIRATPWPARKFNTASRSAARSGTDRMWVTSTPSSARRSEIQGPFRSVTRPATTSVPVTTIPARTASELTGGGSRTARALEGRGLDASRADVEARGRRGSNLVVLAVHGQGDGSAAVQVEPVVVRGWLKGTLAGARDQRLCVDQGSPVAGDQADLHVVPRDQCHGDRVL